MTLLDTIIKHAQDHFGDDPDDPGVPREAQVRPRLPPWLEGGMGEAVSIEPGDWPVLEGDADSAGEAATPGQGASVDEFFAFYLPFHFYRDHWGTYIRALGIDRLARILAAPQPIDGVSLRFAFRLLLEHERLHFLTEVAASRVEVVVGLPSYRPYFRDKQAAEHEEALANAQALTAAKRGFSGPLAEAAASWMSQQGPGYRDFSKWLGRRLPHGRREAAGQLVRVVTSERQLWHAAVMARALCGGHGWLSGPLEFLFQERRKQHPRTYLVFDRPVPWLRVARPFPKLYGLQVFVHTNDHKPPHIHVVVLDGRTPETRYEWPGLRPLRGDRRLSRANEKSLRAYVDAVSEIEAKIQKVPWK